jgi:hypothetical protein
MSGWDRAKTLLEGYKFKVDVDTDYDIDFAPINRRNDTLMDEILGIWEDHAEEIKKLLDKVNLRIQNGKTDSLGTKQTLGDIQWQMNSEFQQAMAEIRYMMSLPAEKGDRIPDWWRNMLTYGGGLGQPAPDPNRPKRYIPLADRDNDPLDQDNEFGRDDEP